MHTIICPLDGKLCAPACPDRLHVREEGGCLLTLAAEMGCTVIYCDEDGFQILSKGGDPL